MKNDTIYSYLIPAWLYQIQYPTRTKNKTKHETKTTNWWGKELVINQGDIRLCFQETVLFLLSAVISSQLN